MRQWLAALLVAGAAAVPIACGSSASTNITGPTATKCQVTLSNSSSELPSSGGTGTLTVSSERECSWSASTTATWLALASTSGQGPATIDYSVQPNPNGTSRQAQVVVSNESVAVVQAAAPCKFSLSPANATVDAPSGTVTFALTATSGCQWSARSNADWIGGALPSSGTGNATVRFSVSANPDAAARVGTVTIGDAQATVQQAGLAAPAPTPAPTPSPEPTPTPEPPPPAPPPPSTCTFTVAPLSASVAASGGQVQISVAAPDGCTWPTASNAPWIVITAGATGSGAGTVVATVAPNTGAERTGTLIVAGRTVTITQAAQAGPACTYQLTPPSLDLTSNAQDSTIAVSAPDGCQWKPASSVPWITVDDHDQSGNGTFKLSVSANTGDARTGTVLVGTATLAVRQAAGTTCSYAIAPTSYSAGMAADAVDVNVTAGATCAWTAASGAAWVTVASGSAGTGNGIVHLAIDANTGTARSAVVTIANQPFNIQQSGVCTYSIKPTSYQSGKGPDTISVNVTADPGCAWTASSPVTWATIADGATGTGNGVVKIAVQANDGPTRQATLTIASQPFQLTQNGK